MSESIRDVLAREATAAEARAEAEERGEIAPTRGQRGRKHAADPSQVYTVRIPVSKLRKLRRLADQLDIAPSVLIRQWVIERLDESDKKDQGSGEGGSGIAPEHTDHGGLRLGPSRRRHESKPNEPCGGQVRLYA